MRIESAKLADTVMGYIEEYHDEAILANEKAVRRVAQKATKELKKSGTYGGTKYRQSLSYSIDKTRISVTANVGSRKYPGLTHLLEFGHALKGGGRTTEFKFVAPINDTIEEKYVTEMEKLLK